MIFDILSFSAPLILAATGALFSEFAGILAIFLDGLITLSGFLMFLFTDLTNNVVAGTLLTLLCSCLITLLLSLIIEKTKANKFIAAIGMNLFFGSLPSLISSIVYKTRGVITSADFAFSVSGAKITTIIITAILVVAAFVFLFRTQKGIYIRVTGSDSDVLLAKGINPVSCRLFAWIAAAFFAAWSGIFLSLRISSFVPNLAGGKGWMALAAVFLGKKKIWKISLCLVIFCAADYFCAGLQNLVQGLPSSIWISLPYFVVLALIAADR